MKKIAKIGNNERKELFEATAAKVGIRPDAVEKDFWICYMIDHLFNDSAYKNALVFKGGTSLSKSYHAIERFSEDIDLILDWREITEGETNPWTERSKKKQDQYNKQLNKEAAAFYRETLVPTLNAELGNKLGGEGLVSVDPADEMVVNFYYPQLFDVQYLRPAVRLEIGPLAEWLPSHITTISPFAAEKYPELFEQKSTQALTIDVERTFWEKITILHKIANFPDDKKLPERYARHLYDVFCMGHSPIKELAFARSNLLEQDVAFKQKFYYSKGAHYESATLKDVKLSPKENILDALRADYKAMENMIYGEIPSFDSILSYLEELEAEIHSLSKE